MENSLEPCWLPHKPEFHALTLDKRILRGWQLLKTINKAFVHMIFIIDTSWGICCCKQINVPTLFCPQTTHGRDLPRLHIGWTEVPQSPWPRDFLRNWLLQTFSLELAALVAPIFNASICQAQVPNQWKGQTTCPFLADFPRRKHRLGLLPNFTLPHYPRSWSPSSLRGL